MADPVTPQVGLATQVVVGNTPVTVFVGGLNGGYITNPVTAAEQGIGTPEPIYVDPTGADPGLEGNGSVFAIWPGQTWSAIPGQTTPTKVNAPTSGHKFTAVSF